VSVRVGFVGAGGIARAHIGALSQMEDVELGAFCDVQEDRAEDLAAAHNARAYTDHREMLEREELQALYICVPPGCHTDVDIIAASKGIHLQDAANRDFALLAGAAKGHGEMDRDDASPRITWLSRALVLPYLRDVWS